MTSKEKAEAGLECFFYEIPSITAGEHLENIRAYIAEIDAENASIKRAARRGRWRMSEFVQIGDVIIRRSTIQSVGVPYRCSPTSWLVYVFFASPEGPVRREHASQQEALDFVEMLTGVRPMGKER